MTHDRRTASGVAWSVEGSGPALVFTNGIACPTFYWDATIARLRGRGTAIGWDLPGHGDSDPADGPAGATVEACADRMVEVMDAAGVERATWLGFSMGCQVVLEAWRRAPHRCAGLVLALGAPGRPFDHFIHPSLGPLFGRSLDLGSPRTAAMALRSGWVLTRVGVGHRMSQAVGFVGRIGADRMEPFYRHLRHIHSSSWLDMARAAREHDATEVLPTITVPTLVIAGGRDRFTPGRLGRQMAATIPGAELLELPHATHTGLLDEEDLVTRRIEAFVLRHGLVATQG